MHFSLRRGHDADDSGAPLCSVLSFVVTSLLHLCSFHPYASLSKNPSTCCGSSTTFPFELVVTIAVTPYVIIGVSVIIHHTFDVLNVCTTLTTPQQLPRLS